MLWLIILLLLQNNITKTQAQEICLSKHHLHQEQDFSYLWKYSPLDSAAFAHKTYDDSSWERLQTSSQLHELSKWRGKGWFRLHIRVDSTLFYQTISLSLWHRSAAEVYFDGKLVQAFGKIADKAELEREEGSIGMPIPLYITPQQHHILAIRFSNHTYHRLAAIYSQNLFGWSWEGFTVSFHEYSQHLQFMMRSRSLRLIVAMLPIGVLLFLALLHGLMYTFSRRDRTNMAVALFSAVMGLLCFSMMYRHISAAGREVMIWNEIILTFEIGLVGLTLGATVDWTVYKSLRPSWWRVTLPLVVALVLSRFFIPVSHWNIFIVICLGAEFIRIVMALMHATRKQQAGTGIIGAGMFVFFLTAAIVSAITMNRLLEIFWVYALMNYLLFLSMPVALAFFMAQRFERVNAELSERLEFIKALSERTIEQEQEKQRLMERQNEELERVVKERTQQLEDANAQLQEQKFAIQQANIQLLKKNVTIAAEQEKSEELLLSILPEPIAQRLKNGEQRIADRYEEVTVMFADIAGFTRFASHIDPQELVSLLDNIFSDFDKLVEKYGVEKIKTIGDSYMIVGGLQRHQTTHAELIARLALEMQESIMRLSEHMGIIGLTVRIGIHCGAAVAGVIGKKKPNYDLWGDTVNIASRMESHGEAGKIHVSEEVYHHLAENFVFRERGEIRIKGKGTMRTYFLECERKRTFASL